MTQVERSQSVSDVTMPQAFHAHITLVCRILLFRANNTNNVMKSVKSSRDGEKFFSMSVKSSQGRRKTSIKSGTSSQN